MTDITNDCVLVIPKTAIFEYSLLALEPLQAQNHYNAARGRFIRPFF